MLERILKLNDSINNILQRKENKKHADKKISDEELTNITELCNVLEPFYYVTVQISSQKFATLSMVIPAVHALYESVIFQL